MPSSSSTVVIGAIFGGGTFVIGAGGKIVGTLPPGIVEVGGIYPVPVPPPGSDDPGENHSSLPASTTSSSESSSAAPSSSTCPRPVVTKCNSACNSDDPDDDIDEGDGDTDAQNGVRSFITRLHYSLLRKRDGLRCECNPGSIFSADLPNGTYLSYLRMQGKDGQDISKERVDQQWCVLPR